MPVAAPEHDDEHTVYLPGPPPADSQVQRQAQPTLPASVKIAQPDTAVRLIRCFEGPRHDRLHALWDCIAEYVSPFAYVRVLDNPGAKLSHAQCLQRAWAEELEYVNPFVVFTEYDFLPNLHTLEWLGGHVWDQYPLAAVMYSTRDPNTRRAVQYHDAAGAWWVAIDKRRCGPALTFEGRPDPCNQLLDQVDGAVLFMGNDAMRLYPPHYGLAYPWGEHLFWGRHLHDPPGLRIGGFKLGHIHLLHDEALRRWYHTTPVRYRQIVQQRCPSLHSGLCSACTDAPGTYQTYLSSCGGGEPDVRSLSP